MARFDKWLMMIRRLDFALLSPINVHIKKISSPSYKALLAGVQEIYRQHG